MADAPPDNPNPTPPAEAAAETAVASGQSPARAREAAESAARETRPELTEAEASRIADGVIDRMEKRGIFDEPEPEPAPENPAPDQPGAETPPTQAEQPPQKRTFAARFMGHK